jgi:hypothetical protein
MGDGQTTDTARDQVTEVILELAVLYRHRQGFTSEFLLKREHKHP